MNVIDKSLLDGRLICLTPIDVDKDAEVEAKWTHDPEYLRLLSVEVVRPLSPAHLKKKYEDLEKKMAESGDQFYFAIRLREGDGAEGENSRKDVNTRRLVGFTELTWVSWNHQAAYIMLGIGNPEDRGKGYGSETLALMLNYVFHELNLFRLTAVIPEYNRVAMHLFEQAGFVEEVCRQQTLHRDGSRWDVIHMGILRAEWDEKRHD
jgi:RimJ/RimL family protein N-acetyltransferase